MTADLDRRADPFQQEVAMRNVITGAAGYSGSHLIDAPPAWLDAVSHLERPGARRPLDAGRYRQVGWL